MFIRRNRVEAVAEAFSLMGYEGLIRFDSKEPEYATIKTLYEHGLSPEFLALTVVCAGVNDFQLGAGGAEAYWSSLTEIVSRNLSNIRSVEDVRRVMEEHLKEPVCKRLITLRRERLRRFFGSGFPKWLMSNLDKARGDPRGFWIRLAQSLNNELKQKTVVFTVKVFDLFNLVVYGEYLSLPYDIPIPVDVHVARVALSSGIVGDVKEELVRRAWAMVAEGMSKRWRIHVSLLRLDSLVWQIGKIMSRQRFERASCKDAIIRYLSRELKIPSEHARAIAEEMMYNIEILREIHL
ncbi:N-glycosylase/DNA lyase [Candidatus Bathyarchaeota archaeon]|nr:N-glycosylase/DNA lyase [Candidatus Bathyarchaeota archaeon]